MNLEDDIEEAHTQLGILLEVETVKNAQLQNDLTDLRAQLAQEKDRAQQLCAIADETISSLLKTVDSLRAELAALSKTNKQNFLDAVRWSQENDRLKAEVEEAKADVQLLEAAKTDANDWRKRAIVERDTAVARLAELEADGRRVDGLESLAEELVKACDLAGREYRNEERAARTNGFHNDAQFYKLRAENCETVAARYRLALTASTEARP